MRSVLFSASPPKSIRSLPGGVISSAGQRAPVAPRLHVLQQNSGLRVPVGQTRSLGFVKLDCLGKGITLTEGSRSAASKTAAQAEIKTPSPDFCGEGASHWISRVRRGDGGSADARVPNISPELRFGMRPAG